MKSLTVKIRIKGKRLENLILLSRKGIKEGEPSPEKLTLLASSLLSRVITSTADGLLDALAENNDTQDELSDESSL